MKGRLLVLMLPCLFLVPLAGAVERPTGKTFRNSIGMDFVRIDPGSFIMGHDGSKLPASALEVKEAWLRETGDYDETPAHKVTVSKPFYIGVREVTNREWEFYDRLHFHQRGRLGFSVDDNEAVVFVSWHEARAFCEWLSKTESLPYRLPTEAEWEYAARAGTTTAFSTGDRLPEGFLKNPTNSWFPLQRGGPGRAEIVPLHVGKTPPNPWGLFDVHGNVEEWTADWYGPYTAEAGVDPVGRVTGDFRVTRGGSHSTWAYYLRSANRMGTLPEDRSWYIGLRVVIGEMPSAAPLPPVALEQYQQNVRQGRPPKGAKTIDRGKPYFRGPRVYVKIPPGSDGPLFAKHNHAPAIAESANGDLLAAWYTTVTERGREIAVAASRLRFGEEEWEPASPFWDPPDRNDSALALWSDGKVLYHFNSLSVAATWGPMAVIMRTSHDNGVTWSPASLILPDHSKRHQVVASPFRTREGYLALPCDASPSSSGGTALHISRDGGKTWIDPGGTIAGIHAGIAQLRDGRLIAFGRGDNINGRAPRSISSDLGKTWTYSASPFSPVAGGQRLVLKRLKEGPLLIVTFANEPTLITDASGKRRPVTGMIAALSYDGGATWPNIRLVSDDGPAREVEGMDGARFVLSRGSAEPKGYLTGTQAADGTIHVISSRNHYAFNLKWLETPAPDVSNDR